MSLLDSEGCAGQSGGVGREIESLENMGLWAEELVKVSDIQKRDRPIKEKVGLHIHHSYH